MSAHSQNGEELLRELNTNPETGLTSAQVAELLGKLLYVMWVAMAYRDYGMTAVKVGIDLSVLIPKCCIQAFYRLYIP